MQISHETDNIELRRCRDAIGDKRDRLNCQLTADPTTHEIICCNR